MKKMLLLTAVLLLGLELPVSAQGFNMRSMGKNRRNDIPTTIKSDAMDLDMAANRASFLGNVVVNDQDMTITCRKMTIFLYESKEEKTAGQDKKKNTDDEETLGGGRKLDRIECMDNVVITRKRPGANTAGKEQKATAGKAVYDFRKGTITLTIDPVVSQGTDSKLRGEVITLFLESERVSVVSGTLTSSDVGGLQENMK